MSVCPEDPSRERRMNRNPAPGPFPNALMARPPCGSSEGRSPPPHSEDDMWNGEQATSAFREGKLLFWERASGSARTLEGGRVDSRLGAPFSALLSFICSDVGTTRRVVGFGEDWGSARRCRRTWRCRRLLAVGWAIAVLLLVLLALLIAALGSHGGPQRPFRAGKKAHAGPTLRAPLPPPVPLTDEELRELFDILDGGRLDANGNREAAVDVDARPQARQLGELHAWLKEIAASDSARGARSFVRLARFLRAMRLFSWDLPTGLSGVCGANAGRSSECPGVEVPEVEVRQPFDEIELLKERHAERLDATLGGLRPPVPCLNIFSSGDLGGEDGVGDVSTYEACAEELRARAAHSSALYNVSSALNRRYYYPVRRWERLQPVSGASVGVVDAWFTALSSEVGYYAGAGDAFYDEESLNGVDTRQPVSLLRLPPLDVAEKTNAEPFLASEKASVLSGGGRDGLAAADVKTIFVSIASYRDTRCGKTVVDMMRKAKNLHRVHLGIAQQNAMGDASCLPDVVFTPMPCSALPSGTDDKAANEKVERRRASSNGDARGLCFFHDNIRIREIHSSQALGPTFGRYMAMLLYRGESLVMVLDSHNRFKPRWDSIITNLYYKYEDPKAILSHYPPSDTREETNTNDSEDKEEISYLCKAHYDKDLALPVLSASLIQSPAHFHSNLRYNDPYVAVQSKDIRPSDNFRLPQPWAAGGFMFGSDLMMREVPFDPHIPNIFQGEEVLYSVRLWTHGFNIYSPSYSILFHYYLREDSPKVWNEAPLWRILQIQSRKRVHYLIRSRFPPNAEKAPNNTAKAPLRVPPSTREATVLLDVDRYGVGRVRTVEQWYDYAGLDPIHYTTDRRWC